MKKGRLHLSMALLAGIWSLNPGTQTQAAGPRETAPRSASPGNSVGTAWTYCNGQARRNLFVALYPNGRPVHGGIGGYLYPNGRPTRDLNSVLYPNGTLVKDRMGLYPIGNSTKNPFSCVNPDGRAIQAGLGRNLADPHGHPPGSSPFPRPSQVRVRMNIADFGRMTATLDLDTCEIRTATFEVHGEGDTTTFDLDFKTGEISNIEAFCD